MNQVPIATLQANFSGEIILPKDAAYEQASTTLTATGAPALIVRPTTTEAITKAVLFAAAHGLTIAVRSGGHGGSTNTGGLVIDMAQFADVELVDEAKHLVKIGAGAKWGAVSAKLQQYGLAISAGDTRSVGVGGLTLGGGIGLMVRKYGLAIDSLVGVTLVTAKGEVVHADATTHADLFWAVRGGSGGLGVVVDFDFVAQPITNVYAGVITYAADNLTSLMHQWRDHMRRASEDVATVLMAIPAKSFVLAVFCYAQDDAAGAQAALDPLLHMGTVLNNTVARKPYAEALQDPPMPPGLRLINSSAFVQDLSDEVLAAIVASKQTVQLRILGGAVRHIDAAATAFAHRDAEALVVANVFVPRTASEAEIHSALQPWDAIAKFSTGSYSNFSNLATENAWRDAYPPATYERLLSIQETYDPNHLFSRGHKSNQSVLTAAEKILRDHQRDFENLAD